MEKHMLIDVRNIAPKDLPYIATWIVYYAWVIVFTTWWTASPAADAVFSADARATLHAVNLLASAFFVVVLKREWFAGAARIGGGCLLAVFAASFALPMPAQLHTALNLLLGVAMGLVNAGILVPFVFVLNNTGKFYAVVGANLLISALMLLQESGLADLFGSAVFPFAMLLAGLLPLARFRRGDFVPCASASLRTIPKAEGTVYFTIFLNCLYAILCKGVGKMYILLADAQTPLALSGIYYAGAILGCAVYYFVYAALRNSNIATWNITFGSFVIAMLLYAAGRSGPLLIVFAVLLGIGSTMGMINMYYILGVIGKKYQSMGYVRASIVVIGCVGGITGVVLGKWASAYPDGIALTVAAVSAAVIVLLLIVSPTLSRIYYSREWSEDSRKPEIDNEKVYMFARFGLSKRETELCKLFLEGYTMRQSAAVLGISYATVNTYQTSLYRKLGINSRTELLLLFREYLQPRA
ncbi:MAG: helix-turn-helix transcriptional regulator [Oscillospiraceae bacterium]|nr:helix-turn-helix transcriptional regulator [Oscillospiraceae bacterium]